jgi:hypothetical protein
MRRVPVIVAIIVNLVIGSLASASAATWGEAQAAAA